MRRKPGQGPWQGAQVSPICSCSPVCSVHMWVTKTTLSPFDFCEHKASAHCAAQSGVHCIDFILNIELSAHSIASSIVGFPVTAGGSRASHSVPVHTFHAETKYVACKMIDDVLHVE